MVSKQSYIKKHPYLTSKHSKLHQGLDYIAYL